VIYKLRFIFVYSATPSEPGCCFTGGFLLSFKMSVSALVNHDLEKLLSISVLEHKLV
jgi:hypothetical protein